MKGKDLKPHIGIFGRRNNGKSTLINYLTDQKTAIVSSQPGTTTDPVKKSVEIFGIGPAVVIDTAGIDDSGELGNLRVDKTMKVIPTIDMAILVISGNVFADYEKEIIKQFKYYDVPFLVLHNKSDEEPLDADLERTIKSHYNAIVFDFNTFSGSYKDALIKHITETIPKTVYASTSLFDGIVKPKDFVLLVTPIDSEAPVGRMILPQVMAWRDLLDKHCICASVRETELEDFLAKGVKPDLVVTDSQVFTYVSSVIAPDTPLTSFSIIFARYRGNFPAYMSGTPHIDKLKDKDRVLILESCTHQVSCDDIGRYKIPKWLKEFTGKNIEFTVVAGLSDIPGNIQDYAMVIQCGGCVVTRKQLEGRLKPFIEANTPVSNYGMVIAYTTGIFNRVTEIFR